MSREKEIENVLNFYASSYWDNTKTVMSDKELGISFEGFRRGAKWADKHPISPWISVKKDLPCNHEELIKLHRITKYVIVMYKDGSVALDRMVKMNNGYWRFVGAVTHWFPIPELPKE